MRESVRHRVAALCAGVVFLSVCGAASAQSDGSGDGPPPEEVEGDVVNYTSTTTAPRPDDGRSGSTVTQDELEVRLPRSAPDALRYEPGVFVQQTAHSQGSPYIRGRTGQQTVMLFDGVRLNNSTFRQGPNQYFFTIDSRTIEGLTVVRGSASTRYGSDAMAGVIHADPLDPTFDVYRDGFHLAPRGTVGYGTADGEIGGRLQLDMQFDEYLGVLAGVGYRTVGQLESGGAVRNPENGELPEVPRFEEDGRTQRGTGFDELTADVRTMVPLSPALALTTAFYGYYQTDAPRTDQCAPPYAPFDECLTYDEQHRTLVYSTLEGELGPAAEDLELTLSWQRQHERRTHERPGSFTVNGGRDDVNTFGVAARVGTERIELSDSLAWRARYGVDAYLDVIDSAAWLIFSDVNIVRNRSRGQYIDGSTYAHGGVWIENELRVLRDLDWRVGGRVAHVRANAHPDPESGTLAVDQAWTAFVGGTGLEWFATRWMTLFVSADQGFRAPNLDDLTSRQQTGPGYQIENAGLVPERALTLELGANFFASDVLRIDAWVYRATYQHAIERSTRGIDDCPPNTPACGSSWSQFQLINLDGTTEIIGAEGAVEITPIDNLTIQSAISWAWGEGNNPVERPPNPDTPYRPHIPLSRIPPLNGNVEVLWDTPVDVYLGGAIRWATLQDRLAPSDRGDARIPLGGTPGYIVTDLRAGYRWRDNLLVSLVAENLGDVAYRYHGSSVNGAGRSLFVQLEGGL